MRRLSLWSMLAFVHRWLGIACGALFLLWFVSGIAMMYVRMPDLSDADRLTRLPRIDASQVRLAPADAVARTLSKQEPLRLTMIGSRPVYRFGRGGLDAVYADNGQHVGRITPGHAQLIAADFVGASSTPAFVAELQQADQWTLQLRPHFPLFRFTVPNADRTDVYVSSRTGDVVMQTTRRGRALAYIGPVAHWLYLPVLRRNGPLWTNVIVWSSGIGCLLCLSGLITGLLRFAPFTPFRHRTGVSRSPYSGWMRWHHYAGLTFGVVTFTWTFSGLLSMDPFPILSGGGVRVEEQTALSGSGMATLPALGDVRRAIAAADEAGVAKELRLIWFRERGYWVATDGLRRQLIPIASSESDEQQQVTPAALEAAARESKPGYRAVDLTWLRSYDAYYYDAQRRAPLPVLRAEYDDPEQSWIYFDPSTVSIVGVARRADRVNRWLYHGLHSLDPAWLRARRPLWDIVVIALSLGGLFTALAAITPAARRLRRLLKAVAGD